MFLHIGGDIVIPIKNIIAIFDIETTTVSRVSKDFLRVAEEEGFINTVNQELPKSFVITEAGKKSKIYLSPISSTTLQKRAGYFDGIAAKENRKVKKRMRKNREEGNGEYSGKPKHGKQ